MRPNPINPIFMETILPSELTYFYAGLCPGLAARLVARHCGARTGPPDLSLLRPRSGLAPSLRSDAAALGRAKGPLDLSLIRPRSGLAPSLRSDAAALGRAK